MQKLLPFCFALLFTSTVIAQLNAFHIGYQGTVPLGAMQHGWSSGHGIHFGYNRAIKSAPELSFGFNAGLAQYAHKRQPQQFVFRDGSITHTHVNLSSSLMSFAGTARYTFQPNQKVTPFVELQTGYFGMESGFYIEDPTDPLGCRALEASTVLSDGTFFGSVGAGVTFNLSKPGTGDRHQLQVGVWSGRGGPIEYANMNRVAHRHHDDGLPNPTVTPSRGNPEPFMATFVNVTTNELHRHSIAEMYNHKLRMLQLQVTYMWWFRSLKGSH